LKPQIDADERGRWIYCGQGELHPLGEDQVCRETYGGIGLSAFICVFL